MYYDISTFCFLNGHFFPYWKVFFCWVLWWDLFGFLYVLSACIKFLYSWSWFAVCMSFAVERSRDSYLEALMTLIFACFGCGFTCIGVYLSMY